MKKDPDSSRDETQARRSGKTQRATRAFVESRAAHSEDEDLHPTGLDPPAAALERALEAEDERPRRKDG